jgi:hypothetical protein
MPLLWFHARELNDSTPFQNFFPQKRRILLRRIADRATALRPELAGAVYPFAICITARSCDCQICGYCARRRKAPERMEPATGAGLSRLGGVRKQDAGLGRQEAGAHGSRARKGARSRERCPVLTTTMRAMKPLPMRIAGWGKLMKILRDTKCDNERPRCSTRVLVLLWELDADSGNRAKTAASVQTPTAAGFRTGLSIRSNASYRDPDATCGGSPICRTGTAVPPSRPTAASRTWE